MSNVVKAPAWMEDLSVTRLMLLHFEQAGEVYLYINALRAKILSDQVALEAISNLEFFCFDCQSSFDQDEMPGDGSDPEEHATCPNCGSEEVSEADYEIAAYALKEKP